MIGEAARRPFTITRMARLPDGTVEAFLSMNGTTVRVDNRYGSWQADVRSCHGARTFVRRDVLPIAGRELQARARRLEP